VREDKGRCEIQMDGAHREGVQVTRSDSGGKGKGKQKIAYRIRRISALVLSGYVHRGGGSKGKMEPKRE